jgi:hypothetical protein
LETKDNATDHKTLKKLFIGLLEKPTPIQTEYLHLKPTKRHALLALRPFTKTHHHPNPRPTYTPVIPKDFIPPYLP